MLHPSRGRVSRHRVAGTLVALVGTVACETSTAPDALPEALVREVFVAPTTYRSWWADISACSRRTGRFERLRFYSVVSPITPDGTRFPCGGGLMCNGLWEAPHDITVAPTYMNSERLVKHEMLHDLLGRSGHPPVFEACGVSWDDTHVWIPPDNPDRSVRSTADPALRRGR